MAPAKFIINEPIPIREGRNGRVKPPIIEITQSTSQPADPDTPSFLTTLPAEIRNAVYAILFKRDKPIEILDKAYQREYPSWIDDGDISDEEAAELEAASCIMRKTHDFGQGINLLRTCRQVCWEAVGTLYSGNSFCVTVAEHRHNTDFFQIPTAAKFIQSIGTHVFFIEEISIDVSRVCPPQCRESRYEDFLPLARVLWSRPSVAHRVKFTTGEYHLHSKVHDQSDYEDTLEICVARLNRILRALCVTDQLQLRRYSRFERLIEYIDLYVYNDAGGGLANMVCYGGSPTYDAEVRVKIDEADGDFTLSLDPALSFMGLPYMVHRRIVEYVLSPCKQLEFDLQSHTVTGIERSVTQLNQRYRGIAQSYLARSHQFTLSMESSETKTSFNNFAKLREWWEGPFDRPFDPFRCLHGSLCDDPPGHKILLNFNAPHMSLAGLRINVVSFIRLTYYMNKNTTVRIIPRLAEESDCADEAYEIKLQTLRRRCFVLLSAMLLQKPTYAGLPAPDIWIDGTGIPIEVAWPGPKAGHIRRGSDFPLNAAALRETGVDYITEITSTRNTDSWPPAALTHYGARCDSIKTSTSLMSMWLSLRAFDWNIGTPKLES
jgi:hypothetical protein